MGVEKYNINLVNAYNTYIFIMILNSINKYL